MRTAPRAGSPDGIGARPGFAAAAARQEAQRVLAADEGTSGGEQRPLGPIRAEPASRGRLGHEPVLEVAPVLYTDKQAFKLALDEYDRKKAERDVLVAERDAALKQQRELV